MASVIQADLKNFIGGEFVAAAETEDVISPSTGEVIGRAPVSNADEVDAAVRAATEAFKTWRFVSPKTRSNALLALADAVEEHGDELIALEEADTGHLHSTMADTLEFGADCLRFFAGAARNLEGKASAEYLEGFTSVIRREPIGVAAQITPWNAPFDVAIWKIGSAMAAGCTSVLKPAENTPLSTFKLAELAADIFPAGVLNVIGGHGGNGAGAALVTHPDVDIVSLTGSPVTGKWIGEHAGAQLKRTHLELGGKAPVIVFDDWDPELALEFIPMTAFWNAGQDCTASSRILASDKIYDDVVAGLTEQAKGYTIGDIEDESTKLGPMITEKQRTRAHGFIERIPDHAEILTGGAKADRAGFYYEPTVIAGLRQDDEMSQDEIFGPVMTVQRFSDEAEVIEMANSTRYGLGGSVWTTNTARAFRVAGALRTGVVWINCHIVGTPEMPHGGIKQSGHGKDMSAYAVEDYQLIKHVMLNLEQE